MTQTQHSAGALAKAIRHALSGSSSPAPIPISEVYTALLDDTTQTNRNDIFVELAALSAPPRWSAQADQLQSPIGLTLDLATQQLVPLQSEWQPATISSSGTDTAPVGTMRR